MNTMTRRNHTKPRINKTENQDSKEGRKKEKEFLTSLPPFVVVPIGAVPLLPPAAAAAPLRQLREAPHTGALPHPSSSARGRGRRLVADPHAEQLHGAPRRARPRVVPVVPALRAPPRPSAARRRRSPAARRHASWRTTARVRRFLPLFLPFFLIFFIQFFLFFFEWWSSVFIRVGEKRRSARDGER